MAQGVVISSEDLEKAMAQEVAKFKKINYKLTQEALDEVADELASILAQATPAASGTFKRSWRVKPYSNVKFVYNERGTRGINQGIPMTNITEYSRRGPKPFIKEIWERNRASLTQRFVQIMESKLKNM